MTIATAPPMGAATRAGGAAAPVVVASSSASAAHAAMALLGCHLAVSLPLLEPSPTAGAGAAVDASWSVTSAALVQFIQEATRAEQQRGTSLLQRLRSLLQNDLGGVAAALAGDPQDLPWLSFPNSKQIMQKIIGTVWDPHSEEQVDKCLYAVASAVIDHWCMPQLLDKLKEDLVSKDLGQPPASTSLFRPGAVREEAEDVPWSMNMPQAVDLARLDEGQRGTTAKQIQNMFEQDDRLRVFKLSAPKSCLGVKLHWISILQSYRKAKEREQRAQAEREQREEREQRAQRAKEKKKLLFEKQRKEALQSSSQAAVGTESPHEVTQAQRPPPGTAEASQQADLKAHASRSPLQLGLIKDVLLAACSDKSFRRPAADDVLYRDSLLRHAASQVLLEAFCKREGLPNAVATQVRAAALAAFHQAAGHLGAGILSKLAKHPAFKDIPQITKGYLQVLTDCSDKVRHFPGDSIRSAAARPFVVTMNPGSDWRVQFNVDFIWEAAAAPPGVPIAAPGAAELDSLAPSEPAKEGTGKVTKSVPSSSSSSGSGGSSLGVLPLRVLQQRLCTVLPLSNPGAATRESLLRHLAARALLSALARSLVPGAGAGDSTNVLLSRIQVCTFMQSASKMGEQINKMLTSTFSSFLKLAGANPTQGLVAVLRSAQEKGMPLFRTSLHSDRTTYTVGFAADWIWDGVHADPARSGDQIWDGVHADPASKKPLGPEICQEACPESSASNGSHAQDLPVPSAKSAAPPSLPEGPPAAAATPRPLQGSCAPPPKFAGLKLDPALEAQLSELPAASFKSLVHAAAVACSALDIVSKFKEQAKGLASLPHNKNQAAAPGPGAGAGCQKPDEAGRMNGASAQVVENRVIMRAAVEVLLEGYSRTFHKTTAIHAVELARYAPSIHTMADRVWGKVKLRLADSPVVQDRSSMFKALQSCIHAAAAAASPGEPALMVVRAVDGLRASLTVQRLWACLPPPAAEKAAAAGAGPRSKATATAPVPVPHHAPPALQQLTGGVEPMTFGSFSSTEHSSQQTELLGTITEPPGAWSPESDPAAVHGFRAWPSQATAAPTQAAPASAPPVADDPLASLQDGLPAEWHSSERLMELWQVLLGAVDLVWPRPRPGAVGRQDVDTFVCNVVAKLAVDAGLRHHLAQVGRPPVRVRTEPAAFVAQLQAAGQEAIKAWQAACAGAECGAAGAELVSRGPLYVGVLIAAWHQEQAEGGTQAALLRVLDAPETVVRLDPAGLLDLASSIRLADELALDLLL